VKKDLRVAFFPDSFLEVNGAAMTSQRLASYARDRGYPFLCVHAGRETGESIDGSLEYLALKRSPLSIALDEELAYDPLFQRHMSRVKRKIAEFRPDVIHMTGLNDVSILASVIAWQLQIPLLGSWHTNIHEFAAQRISVMLRFLPQGVRKWIASTAEKQIFRGSIYYYKMPKVVLAPNQELVDVLGKGTGRVARIMGRGVDTDKFSPARRTADDGVFRLGFVGRLRAEKNVRMLVELEKELIKQGRNGFEFLIVGEGSERPFLERHLKHGRITGFLEGEQLSEAYANMDVFVFPSETDAFGNVAQEAFASGVPAIVTDKGGPKFIVEHGKTGFVAEGLADFVKFSTLLMDDRELHSKMGQAARAAAMSRSWEAVFESVFEGYQQAYSLSTRKSNVK
jgi:phosphatidylinositol alpha 1,6-mannosyltransferase